LVAETTRGRSGVGIWRGVVKFGGGRGGVSGSQKNSRSSVTVSPREVAAGGGLSQGKINRDPRGCKKNFWKKKKTMEINEGMGGTNNVE